MKPVYIYKGISTFYSKPINYVRYFLLDDIRINELDQVVYLKRFDTRDELWLNLDINKYYNISEPIFSVCPIRAAYAYIEDVSLIDFNDLLKLFNIVNEEKTEWIYNIKIKELITLVLAKWDEWY